MSRYWIAVASAEHVRRGRGDSRAGFMQVCHGKAAPLKRIQPGDGVIYYSPTESFKGNDKLQKFTAIGTAKNGEPYQVDMGGGFCPFRRDVDWMAANEISITPLLSTLEFSANNRNWGYQMRFGLFEISAHDFERVKTTMQADVQCLTDGPRGMPRTKEQDRSLISAEPIEHP